MSNKYKLMFETSHNSRYFVDPKTNLWIRQKNDGREIEDITYIGSIIPEHCPLIGNDGHFIPFSKMLLRGHIAEGRIPGLVGEFLVDARPFGIELPNPGIVTVGLEGTFNAPGSTGRARHIGHPISVVYNSTI